MTRLIMMLAFAGVAGCAPADEAGDPIDATFTSADGKADTGGIAEGTPEAIGVLATANTLSKADLKSKAKLASNAAAAIDAVRIGDDDTQGTADDVQFATLKQLDDVPYVGPVAFAKLLAYAQANGLVPAPSPSPPPPPPVDPNDPFPDTVCADAPATLAQLASLFAPGTSVADLGTYQIDGRQRTCTAVTGCSAWTAWTPVFANPTGTTTSPVLEHTRLRVSGTGIQLELVHQLCTASNHYDGEWYGATCTGLGGPTVSCPGYYYVLSEQWGGSGGTFCEEGELYLNADKYTLTGVVTPTCFSLEAQAGPAIGTQYAVRVHGAL